jgi:hypothetical protein
MPADGINGDINSPIILIIIRILHFERIGYTNTSINVRFIQPMGADNKIKRMTFTGRRKILPAKRFAVREGY